MATHLGWPKPQPPTAPAGSSLAPSGGIFIKDGDGPWRPLEGDLSIPGDPILDDRDLPWMAQWPA
jgi:hypothetical protein